MVCNAQALDNLNPTIRRRLNVEVNLAGISISTWKPLFMYYKVCFRHRTGNIEVADSKNDIIDDYTIQRGLIFPAFQMYDTHCYSRRYERVPYKEEETFYEWKLDDPITAPYGKQIKYTAIVPEEPKKEEPEEKENTDVETSVEEGEENGI